MRAQIVVHGIASILILTVISLILTGTYPLTLSVSGASGNVNSASTTVSVQEVGVTPPGYKVAFIADQGLGVSDSKAVLNVIKNEGADMVIHAGDYDYSDNPDRWDDQINRILGADYPYFAAIGNHDVAAWPGYQQKLIDRLARIDGAVCTTDIGGIGVKQSCTYNGLFFILSGAGTMGSGHATYIKDKMAQDNSIWRICSWHKNMKAMQVGGKSDSTGWKVYEECRIAGAIIATGHEHSYERTRTLSSIQNQIIDSAWPDVNNVRVGDGSSFVFVSGLGGQSIRNQDRCLPFTFPYGCNNVWASIYTTDQSANYGALFCSFNVGGQANKAHCYFKDIDGFIPDQFDVTSFNSVPAGSPPTAQPDTATTAEDTTVSVNVLINDTDPDGDTLFLDSFDPTSVNGGTITRDDKGTPGDTSDDELLYTPSLNFNGVDTFNYIVSDGTLSDTGSVTVTVTAVNDAPTPVNQPPTANAGPDQTVSDADGTGSETVTLNGSGSDPDGTIASYEWTEGAIVLGTTATITPNLSVGTHSIDLTVTDNGGATASDTVVITVNEKPPEPSTVQVFFDDFESPVGNGGFSQWTESGEPDWRIKTPDGKNIPGFDKKNLVAHADNCDSPCKLTVTNSIDLGSYDSATLSFWKYVDRSIDRNEYLKVKISANGGSSWTKLVSWTHGNGDDDQWHQETFDLTGYLTSDFKVKFVTKESKRGEDVAIDNVLIEGTT